MRFFSFQNLAIVLAVWSILIMIFAFSPKMAFDDGEGFNHGVFAHFAAYAIWSGIACGLFLLRQHRIAFFKSFLVACFFSSLIEAGQTYLPYRSGSLEDIAVNMVASAIGCISTWSLISVFPALNAHFCKANL